MNRFKLMICLLASLTVGALYGQEQEVEFKDGSYVVKNDNQGWRSVPEIDTTGSRLMNPGVHCYVNTKDRVIMCYPKGQGPQTFNNVRIIESRLGTQIIKSADYLGTLVVERTTGGMVGGGKRLDFYQEPFVGGVQ